MGFKKFISNVKEILELDEFENEGKKKSVKRLLKKLRVRKEDLEKSAKKESDKKKQKALKEELRIITLQIKKGEKILEALNKKTS
jgi:predicted  nucleic acid-binding Zn-ribbon protein